MFILHVCCLDDLGNGDNRGRWKHVPARALVVWLRETIFYRAYKRLSWQFRVLLVSYLSISTRHAETHTILKSYPGISE